MILYLLFGCVIKSTIELSKAKNVYALAEEAGKVEVYPYEMTYAHSLLNKAWEEYSTANYHTANYLAQQSQDWVNKTRLGEAEGSVEDILKKNVAESDTKLPSDNVSKSSKDENKEK